MRRCSVVEGQTRPTEETDNSRGPSPTSHEKQANNFDYLIDADFPVLRPHEAGQQGASLPQILEAASLPGITITLIMLINIINPIYRAARCRHHRGRLRERVAGKTFHGIASNIVA